MALFDLPPDLQSAIDAQASQVPPELRRVPGEGFLGRIRRAGQFFRGQEAEQFLGGARATAAERASPLLGALREFRGLQLPGVQRREFSTFAQRGFGLSGAARRGVRRRTGIFQARTRSQEQEISRQALADVIQEMQIERQISRGG